MTPGAVLLTGMKVSQAFQVGAGNEKSLTEAHDLIYLNNRLFKASGELQSKP